MSWDYLSPLDLRSPLFPILYALFKVCFSALARRKQMINKFKLVSFFNSLSPASQLVSKCRRKWIETKKVLLFTKKKVHKRYNFSPRCLFVYLCFYFWNQKLQNKFCPSLASPTVLTTLRKEDQAKLDTGVMFSPFCNNTRMLSHIRFLACLLNIKTILMNDDGLIAWQMGNNIIIFSYFWKIETCLLVWFSVALDNLKTLYWI